MGNGRQTILDRLRKTFRIDYDDDCLDKWEGIELVTKSLDQQTESRIGMLLVNADRKSTRLNSSHPPESRMPSSA